VYNYSLDIIIIIIIIKVITIIIYVIISIIIMQPQSYKDSHWKTSTQEKSLTLNKKNKWQSSQ